MIHESNRQVYHFIIYKKINDKERYDNLKSQKRRCGQEFLEQRVFGKNRNRETGNKNIMNRE